MDKNEVIILSSDEENDLTYCLERDSNCPTKGNPNSNNSSEILKSYLQKLNQINKNKNMGVIIKNNKSVFRAVEKLEVLEKKCKENVNESPELVDLVDCIEKPNDNSQFQCSNHDTKKTAQNHSKLDIICIDEAPTKSVFSLEKKSDLDIIVSKEPRKVSHDLPTGVIKINQESTATDAINNTSKPVMCNKETEEFYNKMDEDKAFINQNLQSFTEFVEFCGSLEKIPNDRAKLTKKLMKRYGEADYRYIISQEFRNLVQKCRDKVNTYNLYLIAKEITDELTYRKKIDIKPGKSTQVKKTDGNPQSVDKKDEGVEQISGKRFKNRTKFINKIVKNLDKLGRKIRELEEKEVDLSDEEESAYVLLQRYRERFCQIYTKLCKYTNEVPDAERFGRPKICFTESKYPAINKCIENWLNKTKTFPDFSDIMKLLESQSSSLGLPSNRESIRMIAIEIFQQVGAMLQRRRIYDLWDSFCGFLDEGDDPAKTDPALNEILKSNFEARIKKEQEIFQYFAELQEKERLEPEEVPDEEANRSPVESGNEDHEEIEGIENLINKKLDVAIKRETKEKGNTSDDNASNALGGDRCDPENEAPPHHSLKFRDTKAASKESKNNFKNCKSLKWRSESGGKTINVVPGERNAGAKSENKKETRNRESGTEVTTPEKCISKEEFKNPKESEKNCSHSNLIKSEKIKVNSKEVCCEVKTERVGRCLIGSKRAVLVKDKDENKTPKKKKCHTESKLDIEIFNTNDENDDSNENAKKVFNVHCCQIFTDNVFESLNERKKYWGKRKVFRDLTNVGRLMELHGKRKKMSGLYSPSFFHRSFCEFEKSSWKKRFKVNFRFVGSKDQKCALSQGEKSGKTINSGENAEEKKIQNNSESGRNGEGENFFSGHGNGSEEDNNEDKNKRNGGSTGDVNENQFEEDEDEEENETEKDDSKMDTETAEFFPNKKTEGSLFMKGSNNISSDIQNNSNKNKKSMKLPNARSKTPASSQKASKTEKKENQNESEEESAKKIFVAEKISKRENQKNDRRYSKSKVIACKSESKKDVREGEDEKKNVEMECERILPKIVRRNSKADVQNCATEIDKCDSVRPEAKRSSEVVLNEKLKENADVKVESGTGQSLTEVKDKDELIAQNKRKQNSCSAAAEVGVRTKATLNLKRNESIKPHQTVAREVAENKSAKTWKSLHLDKTNQKFQRKKTPSRSDEEIVKRFLMSSPASISITPPRRLSFSKPPSQAALQALATLRNLKGISTTVVRGKPKNEDDVVVIGGSYKRGPSQNSDPAKSRRSDLPVISSVQSIDSTTPKIVTVQGNVSGFENSWPELSNSSECSSSSIKISNVWGSLPDGFMQTPIKSESFTSGCSSRQNDPGSSNSVKKKNKKKTVEYVVLE